MRISHNKTSSAAHNNELVVNVSVFVFLQLKMFSPVRSLLFLKIILNNLQDAIVNYFGTVQNKFIDYETVSNLTVFNVASSLQLTNQEKYQLISHRYPQLFLLNQIQHFLSGLDG